MLGQVIKGPAASQIAGETLDDLSDSRMRSMALANTGHRAATQFPKKQQQLADQIDASAFGCIRL